MHELFIKFTDELIICREKPPLPNFDFTIYHQYYINNDNQMFSSLSEIICYDNQISSDYFLVYSTSQYSKNEKMINVNIYLQYLKRIIPKFYYPVSYRIDKDSENNDLLCVPFNKAIYIYDYITRNEPHILGTYLENGIYTLEKINREPRYIFLKSTDNNLVKKDILTNEYLYFVSTYLKYEFKYYKKIGVYIFYNRLFMQTELFLESLGEKEKMGISDFDFSQLIECMKRKANKERRW